MEDLSLTSFKTLVTAPPSLIYFAVVGAGILLLWLSEPKKPRLPRKHLRVLQGPEEPYKALMGLARIYEAIEGLMSRPQGPYKAQNGLIRPLRPYEALKGLIKLLKAPYKSFNSLIRGFRTFSGPSLRALSSYEVSNLWSPNTYLMRLALFVFSTPLSQKLRF